MTQAAKEKALKETFNDLIDIAYQDAFAMIMIIEDRILDSTARDSKGRREVKSGVDVCLLKKKSQANK